MFDFAVGGALFSTLLAWGVASGSSSVESVPIVHSPAVVAAQAATTGHHGTVVSTDWLARNLNDPDLVLLHVGDADGFSQHIPGARLLSLRDLDAARGDGDLSLEMPTPEDLRRRLEALGVSDRSRIAVYYGQNWVSPATRVVFTLNEAGLGERTFLLDGGMKAWTDEGHPTVSGVAPAATSGRLTIAAPPTQVVDADFVQAHTGQPGFVLIDARDPEFYTGATPGGPRSAPRAGHIPGAVSLPFSILTDDDLRITPSARLAEMFQDAGAKPGDTIIAYCHIGQQATAVLFAARSLGFKVLLYDGSFEDWALRDLPVETSTGA